MAATDPIKSLFPWPPPTPSTQRSFSPDIIPASTTAKTFGDVASRLKEKVKQAEFDAFGYYGAPGGFALATRIEYLDGATGLPLKGQARWGGTTTYFAGFNFSSIFTTWRPKGVYRTFVFLLTDDPPMTKPMSSAEVSATAKLWAMAGAPSLPPQISSLPIGPHHVLIVMVYEFEKVEGGETKHSIPSHWPLDHHLSSLSFSLKP